MAIWTYGRKRFRIQRSPQARGVPAGCAMKRSEANYTLTGARLAMAAVGTGRGSSVPWSSVCSPRRRVSTTSMICVAVLWIVPVRRVVCSFLIAQSIRPPARPASALRPAIAHWPASRETIMPQPRPADAWPAGDRQARGWDG